MDDVVVPPLSLDWHHLIFGHGGINQLGIKELAGNEHLLGLKNLSTSIVTAYQGGFALDVYNQTAYLDHVDLNEGNVSILWATLSRG
ncbi:hypothetical protein [Lacticaseibacillus thailandensis]|uniref:Uncharacterized protein n=1 Tax=Lacticaseibacillus thailandensis DSM 22698 = JCM 13996 TaxID=1423810 RepID=A0A0R2C5U4_9LACO|nr:hypothetical protein [Lacticaseibacillus thailandensis]KRM86984.1 hypothetical protein FD19_GL001566 [Lacticaseibacillus thailandensis DSM 22698 = JCM 13996]